EWKPGKPSAFRWKPTCRRARGTGTGRTPFPERSVARRGLPFSAVHATATGTFPSSMRPRWSRAMSPRTSASKKEPAKRAEKTAHRQREIAQVAQAANRSAKAKQDKKKPVQAGARRQPVNPMPKQHLSKPGVEADLDLQPRHDAPDY